MHAQLSRTRQAGTRDRRVADQPGGLLLARAERDVRVADERDGAGVMPAQQAEDDEQQGNYNPDLGPVPGSEAQRAREDMKLAHGHGPSQRDPAFRQGITSQMGAAA